MYKIIPDNLCRCSAVEMGARLLISCVASAVTSFKEYSMEKREKLVTLQWRILTNTSLFWGFLGVALWQTSRLTHSVCLPTATQWDPGDLPPSTLHTEPDQRWHPGAEGHVWWAPKVPQGGWGPGLCPQCWPQAQPWAPKRDGSSACLLSPASFSFLWEMKRSQEKRLRKAPDRSSGGLSLLEARGQNQGAHEFGWERVYLYFHQSLNGITAFPSIMNSSLMAQWN